MRRLAALTLALAAVLLPSRLMAPAVYPERPEPVLAWHALGLPSPELMARLVMAESGGNPYAVSSAGAIGLCQLMPSLARSLGADPARLFEPDYNLAVGSRWLGTLIARYGVDGGLRAWNCGESKRHLWYTAPVNEFVRRIGG